MELQKHKLWMLKEHNTCSCPKEFEPDVLIVFVQRGIKYSKFYKERTIAT